MRGSLVGISAEALEESDYRRLIDAGFGSLVVDPVMIAKSGAPLLKPDAIAALKTKLLPLAAVLTPNLHEAGALTGREIKTLAQMKEVARAIRDLGLRRPGDRRVVHIELTKAGHRLVTRIRASQVEVCRDMLARLNACDREDIIRLVAQLAHG